MILVQSMAKFRPGRSGNSAGRPRGVPDRRNQFRDVVGDRISGVVDVVICAALSGDISACKLLLDKLVPNARQVDVPFRLQAVGDSLSDRGESAISAMADGHISPDQAAQVTGALLNMARIREVDDLIARIERLEVQGKDGAAQ